MFKREEREKYSFLGERGIKMFKIKLWLPLFSLANNPSKKKILVSHRGELHNVAGFVVVGVFFVCLFVLSKDKV